MTRRLLRTATVCLVLYWLLIATLTHLPAREIPHVEVNDKVEHLVAFAVLAFLLNLVLRSRTPRHCDWLTLAIVITYGAVDELLQPLTGRGCDLADWFADGAGAATGVVLCNLVCLYWSDRARKAAGAESESAAAEQVR